VTNALSPLSGFQFSFERRRCTTRPRLHCDQAALGIVFVQEPTPAMMPNHSGAGADQGKQLAVTAAER